MLEIYETIIHEFVIQTFVAGWLRAVSNQPTQAFCIYCQKTLPANKLKLLKHAWSNQHERAAENNANSKVSLL